MAKPVLWHIRISHYNEKARWALAYKGVEHERRAPPPGVHMLIALSLTRGKHKTFPVLQLDGEAIGDSTAIIAALEKRFPEPPLYPEDPGELRRALDLEEFFDEELGPHMRRFAFYEAIQDREMLGEATREDLPAPLRRFGSAPAIAARYVAAFVSARYGARSKSGAEAAREKVIAALDRLESELGGGDYLVGGRFTVADLTAAALFYPLVLPPDGPQLPDPSESYERFRRPLKDRPGYRWVEEMFRRHRRPVAAPVAA